MTRKKNNPHRGSSFDDFLKEESLFEEVTAIALKRLQARKRAQAPNKRVKSTATKHLSRQIEIRR
jgi:hypothetical protein